MNKNAVVWAEIPVTDTDKALAFYKSVFSFEFESHDMPQGREVFMWFGPMSVGASLIQGEPASKNGPIIHLMIEGSVEDAIQRVKTAGGQVVSDVISIPPGRYACALDLDGNRIGLFEATR